MAQVEVKEETFKVDGREFSRAGITRIYAKPPKIVEEHARHRPPPARGLFANLGSALGAAVKQRQVDRANREEWEVWADQAGKGVRLAQGLSKEGAEALSGEILSRLLYR